MELKVGTKYIFDTTVFIDALRKHPAYRERIRWMMFQARDKRISAGYSIVTEIELWWGIRGLWTVKQHETILRPFVRYPLRVTIAKRAGEIRKELDVRGVPRDTGPGLLDCVIAATAEYHGQVLITRNADDFNKIVDLSIAKITIEDYK